MNTTNLFQLRPRSDAAAVDALAGLLAQAQAAQQASQLEQGLVLAEQAWSEAQDLGLLAEQIEAGRLRAEARAAEASTKRARARQKNSVERANRLKKQLAKTMNQE